MTRDRTIQSLSSPLLLVLIASVLYLNSFWGVFQFDDYNVIVNNPVVHNWSAWLDDVLYGIRPILKFTYTLNWTSGMGIFGFHLFNLTIHILNAILIYFLSLKVADSITNADQTIRLLCKKSALLAALLWALHPVQTESVTYISGRSSSLMATFYLASILAYIHGSDANKRVWLYFVSPLFFILSVLTKESAVTLPLTLFLWEWVFHKETGFLRTTVKKQVIYWAMLGFIMAVLIIHPNYGGLLEYSFDIRRIGDNLLSQINGITYLLSRLFMLHRLNIDPDLSVISRWTPLVAAEAILLSGLIITGIVNMRKRQWIGFGILWFFLHLLPTNSFVPRLDVANERQLYLPIFGIFLALSIEIVRFQSIMEGWKRHIISVMIAFCIVFGAFTVVRNYTYRSEIALWEDTARKSPQKARVYNNLGYAYALAGRYKDAKESYLRAIALKPDYQLPRENLSELLKKGN